MVAAASPEEPLSDGMPREWGHVAKQNHEGCMGVAGQYYLIGKVVPEDPSFLGTLNYILQVPLPAAAYQPNAEKFATFGIVNNQRIEVTIVLGGLLDHQ
ncbi:MAG: hypothetical protein AABY73_03155 [Pseudomonadota bacterium]